MKIFLLDSNGILCRYFFAMPEMFTEDGLMVNGLFGFCKFVRDLLKKHKNEKFSIVATFDRCSENFRKEIDPNYKKNRKKAESSLIVQMNLAEEFCKNIGISVETHLRYEADDIIASIVSIYEQEHEIVVVSPDKDLLQLVSERTRVFNPFSKKIADIDFVQKKFGVHPLYFYLFLALCGDASDNIPGIQGIGPKTAVKILEKTKDKEEMQKLFPKYNFTKLDHMIKLTTLSREYTCSKITPYVVDAARLNGYLHKMNFHTIKI